MDARPDLGAVFDKHVASEFETKDINATMATMVAEPYVWHVPVLTGASGGDAVRQFYLTRFIGQTPDDAVLHPIARTVSENRVVDEFVLEFTHDAEVPFMLPGVAYEHIYWDQATVLVQLAMLDPARLPVAGAEQADRLLELARSPS
jgi:carboxymethylenebutenolidase